MRTKKVSRKLGAIQFENGQKISNLEDKLTRERQEIAGLRQIVISEAAFRNEKLLEKRISAAEQLWKEALANKKNAFTAKLLRSINIAEVNQQIESESVKHFIDGLSKISGIQSLLEELKQDGLNREAYPDSAASVRPFISPLAWALYSAHSSIIAHATMTLVSWKSGVTTHILENDELIRTSITALPHQKPLLDKLGVRGTYFIVDELEEALFHEIVRFLKLGVSDEEALTNAKEILAASNRANAITFSITTS